jgi:5-methylcytosine-specific restriction endonuclease McrA
MNIYLAGSISDNDWRKEIIDTHTFDYLLDNKSEFPIIENAIFGKHNYTGPYRVYLEHGRGISKHYEHDKHGFNEMDNDVWGMAKIYKSCLKAIAKSDLIIAVIDSRDCYGTLFELGYASALNKTIYIITTLLNAQEDLIHLGNLSNSLSSYLLGGSDLWFTFMSADKIYDTPKLDIKKAIKKLLNIEERIDYKTYLQSEQWKLIRDTALDLYDNKCILCDSTDNLNVHHKTYKNIGNEDIDDLIVLCKRCHRKHHNLYENY